MISSYRGNTAVLNLPDLMSNDGGWERDIEQLPVSVRNWLEDPEVTVASSTDLKSLTSWPYKVQITRQLNTSRVFLALHEAGIIKHPTSLRDTCKDHVVEMMVWARHFHHRPCSPGEWRDLFNHLGNRVFPKTRKRSWRPTSETNLDGTYERFFFFYESNAPLIFIQELMLQAMSDRELGTKLQFDHDMPFAKFFKDSLEKLRKLAPPNERENRSEMISLDDTNYSVEAQEKSTKAPTPRKSPPLTTLPTRSRTGRKFKMRLALPRAENLSSVEEIPEVSDDPLESAATASVVEIAIGATTDGESDDSVTEVQVSKESHDFAATASSSARVGVIPTAATTDEVSDDPPNVILLRAIMESAIDPTQPIDATQCTSLDDTESMCFSPPLSLEASPIKSPVVSSRPPMTAGSTSAATTSPAVLCKRTASPPSPSPQTSPPSTGGPERRSSHRDKRTAGPPSQPSKPWAPRRQKQYHYRPKRAVRPPSPPTSDPRDAPPACRNVRHSQVTPACTILPPSPPSSDPRDTQPDCRPIKRPQIMPVEFRLGKRERQNPDLVDLSQFDSCFDASCDASFVHGHQDIRTRLTLLRAARALAGVDEEAQEADVVALPKDKNLALSDGVKLTAEQLEFEKEVVANMPCVLKVNHSRQALDYEEMSSEERRLNPFVDQPKFYRRCSFCSSKSF